MTGSSSDEAPGASRPAGPAVTDSAPKRDGEPGGERDPGPGGERDPGGRRILVAGGTGFVGGAIVRELRSRGRAVAVLTRHPERAAGRLPDPSVEARGGDITRPETLPGALAGVDTVVQCVQFPGYPVEDARRGRTFMDVDAVGTANLVTAAAKAGVRKFVYLSGVGADPDSPRSWYRAKGLAERAVAAAGLRYVIVRPTWIYGPDDVSLNRFVRVIRLVPGFFPQIGPGNQRINPILIDDVARLVADVIDGETANGRTLEVGGPEVLTLDEIVQAAMRALGRSKPIVHFPLALVKLAALLLEILPGQLLSRDAIDFIGGSAVADGAEAARLFPGFEPTPLDVALASYLGDDA